jgi:hypothetical protein
VRWHREGFKHYWTWKSRRQRAGRPPVDKEIHKLIRRMQSENVGWGAPANARLESMVNYSSWVLKYHKRQFQST